MKKIFFGLLASMLLSNAIYAGDSKKHSGKRAAKKQSCSKANCTPACDPKCVNMPGCVCK